MNTATCPDCGATIIIQRTLEWSQLEVVDHPEGVLVLVGRPEPRWHVRCGVAGHVALRDGEEKLR